MSGYIFIKMLCCCGNDDSDSDSLQDKSAGGITLIKRNIEEERKTPLSSENPRQSRGKSSEKEIRSEVKQPSIDPEEVKINGLKDLPVTEEDIKVDTVDELFGENIDEMSQQALNDAVNRLEAVANRLETLASRSPSGASKPAQEHAEVTAPYVVAFDDLVSGPFKKFIGLSEQIGGDLKTMADLVASALKQQRNLLCLASKRKEPLMVSVLNISL
ncbi:hypothetical protein KUTeg_000089 [Tegillarca granosa]|uniref:CAP N-terminal domain-containing protein n=1 Tax=Tegillarca granosa TaxID=220873 RepID=A0ABQ9FWI5_TEGGR|nr:hypothetical protein KUTeg_000089 [Tegillarca granosa]